MGFELEVVEKVREDSREISSTFIREEIQKGHIKKANHLLGYPYFACGTVVHGKHLGSRLGFATINITPPPEKLLPPFGVYVTQVRIDGRTYRGVTNVGVKPTIEGERLPGIETHIFDFSGELYGERVCVSFFDFLRPEQKFSSVGALRGQVAEDEQRALAYFESCGQGNGEPRSYEKK